MNYYNQDHKRINLNTFKVIGFGGNSTIYGNGSMIFKKYYDEDGLRIDSITEELFNMLKNIHNPHFMELYDLYTKTTFFKQYLETPFKIDGYTAKYYRKSDIDLLFVSIDYILDNFSQLEKLFDLLAEYLITVRDIRLDNTIIGDEYITIIDPDLFKPNQKNINYNRYINKKALISLFNQILFKYLYDNYDIGKHPDLFKYITAIKLQKVTIKDDNLSENTCVSDVLAKRLRPYNHLFDYIVDECKKN